MIAVGVNEFRNAITKCASFIDMEDALLCFIVRDGELHIDGGSSFYNIECKLHMLKGDMLPRFFCAAKQLSFVANSLSMSADKDIRISYEGGKCILKSGEVTVSCAAVPSDPNKSIVSAVGYHFDCFLSSDNFIKLLTSYVASSISNNNDTPLGNHIHLKIGRNSISSIGTNGTSMSNIVIDGMCSDGESNIVIPNAYAVKIINSIERHNNIKLSVFRKHISISSPSLKMMFKLEHKIDYPDIDKVVATKMISGVTVNAGKLKVAIEALQHFEANENVSIDTDESGLIMNMSCGDVKVSLGCIAHVSDVMPSANVNIEQLSKVLYYIPDGNGECNFDMNGVGKPVRIRYEDANFSAIYMF